MTDIAIARGDTFTYVWQCIQKGVFTYKPITAISRAVPARITCTSHGIPDNWKVAVISAQGMKQINAGFIPKDKEFHTATVVDANTVEFNDVDSVNYSTYTSGGYLMYHTPVDLSGISASCLIEDKYGGTTLLNLTSYLAIDVTAKTVTATVPASTTGALTWKKGVFSLKLLSVGGNVTTIDVGKFVVVVGTASGGVGTANAGYQGLRGAAGNTISYTAAVWAASHSNLVLAEGQMGHETDTDRFKLGNGADTWANLLYWRFPARHLDFDVSLHTSPYTFTLDDARHTTMEIRGNLPGDFIFIVPDFMDGRPVENKTSGAFNIYFKTLTGNTGIYPSPPPVTIAQTIPHTKIYIYADGECETLTGTTSGGIGDMVKAIYDPAGKASQVEVVASKNATGGYAGLSGFALVLKNAAGTIASTIGSLATAPRAWLFQDKDGTVALLDDVSSAQAAAISASTPVAHASNTSNPHSVTAAQVGAYTTGQTDALLSAKVNTSAVGAASGVASLDSSGLVPITQIPPAALERMVIVADQAARYALTTATAQNGDTVKQSDTGEMWFVVDQANLGNSAGYSVYTAGGASSVPWSGVSGKPSAITSLSGTNTGDETATTIGALIHGATAKTTPVDADELDIWDSVSNILKKVSWANLKVTLLATLNTWTTTQRGTVTALTSTSGSIAIDFAVTNNFSHTFTENTTLAAPSNMVVGQVGTIIFTQHASAAKTLAYNAAWVEATSGTAPAVSTTVGSINTLHYEVVSGAIVRYVLNKAGIA